jgi:hypothetical protein
MAEEREAMTDRTVSVLRTHEDRRISVTGIYGAHTAQFHQTSRPIMHRHERGEDWWLCSLDNPGFVVDGAASVAHP